MGAPYVDYGRLAAQYRRGRQLPPATLASWRDAVLPQLPATGKRLRLVDVGAGTGMFAAQWPRWTPAEVVAVEPNPAMIAAGEPGVRFVRATAEHLPLPTASMDVVWVSTALHHFVDLPAGISECVRVLRDPGRLLVRTFLPERTEISWVGAFPGYPRALTRFPTLAQLAGHLHRHGLTISYVGEVLEQVVSFARAADWAAQMRHADSMLTALTDAEVAEGLRVLRSQPTRQARVELSLVVFERRAG